MKSFLTHKKGFSLVELIIYIALLATFSVAMVNTLLILTKSWTTVKISKNIAISATSALERVSREVRNAYNINTSQSTFGGTSGELTLNTQDLSGVDSSVNFSLDSGVLKVQRDSGTADNLTLASTPVTALSFYRIVSGESEAVRIQLTLQMTYRGQTSTQTFYTTTSLRGGYQN